MSKRSSAARGVAAIPVVLAAFAACRAEETTKTETTAAPPSAPPPATSASASAGVDVAPTEPPTSCAIVGHLAKGRYDPIATVLLDGRVVIAGGRRHDGSDFLRDVEIFHPDTSKISAGPPLSVARAIHAAVRLRDGRVLVAGGWTERAGGSPSQPPAAEAPVEVLDASGKAWKNVGDYSYYGNAIGVHIDLLMDGRALLTGGDAMMMGRVSPDAVVFDPKTDRLVPLPSMKEGRADHFGEVGADGAVVLWGGYGYLDGMNPEPAPSVTWKPGDSAWGRYDGAPPAWWTALSESTASEWKPIRDTETHHVRAFIAPDALQCFSPSQKKWMPAAKFNRPRTAASGAFLADGRILVVGGLGDDEPEEAIEICSASACVSPSE